MKTVYLCCEVIGGDRCGLIGRFHTYCTCRHCKCCSCAVCVCKDNAAAYNFPLIKYLAGRSRICSQGNGCTFCRFADFASCANCRFTVCNGDSVFNRLVGYNNIFVSVHCNGKSISCYSSFGAIYHNLIDFITWIRSECDNLRCSFRNSVFASRNCSVTAVYACCEVIGRDRDRLPNCGYGSVSSNGNLVAGSLFNTANAPSLELLTGRSSEAVCRERVFAGNTGHICHCACTAVRIKAHGVGRRRRVLMHELEDGFVAYCVVFSVICFQVGIVGSLFKFRAGGSSYIAGDHGRGLLAQCGECHRAATGKVNRIHCGVTCLNNAIRAIIQCQINSRIFDRQPAIFNTCCEPLCAYRDVAVLNNQIAAIFCINSVTVWYVRGECHIRFVLDDNIPVVIVDTKIKITRNIHRCVIQRDCAAATRANTDIIFTFVQVHGQLPADVDVAVVCNFRCERIIVNTVDSGSSACYGNGLSSTGQRDRTAIRINAVHQNIRWIS